MLNFVLGGSSAVTSVKSMKIHSMDHDWTSVEITHLFRKYQNLEKLRIYMEYKGALQIRNWLEQVMISGQKVKRMSIGLFVPVDPKLIPANKKENGVPGNCDGRILISHPLPYFTLVE
jgi:hypothetical protein